MAESEVTHYEAAILADLQREGNLKEQRERLDNEADEESLQGESGLFVSPRGSAASAVMGSPWLRDIKDVEEGSIMSGQQAHLSHAAKATVISSGEIARMLLTSSSEF